MVIKSVAVADFKVDKKEKKAIEIVYAHPDNFKNSLICEIIKNAKNNLHSDSLICKDTILLQLREVSKIVSRHSVHDFASDFKKYLVAIAIYIANASGDMFGPKMCDIESEIINEISLSLELSLGDLKRFPSVQDILDDITKTLKRFY